MAFAPQILDTFPKLIHGGGLKTPKYGMQCLKGSVMCTLDGTVVDYIGLAYGNRTDLDFIAPHYTNMGFRHWERCLADMAYEQAPQCITQYVARRMHVTGITPAQVIHNVIVGFYRSRIEAVIGHIKQGKGIFHVPWRSDIETLEMLLKLEVHATQVERDLYLGPRYQDTIGPFWHVPM